jgi:hypothetical protein
MDKLYTKGDISQSHSLFSHETLSKPEKIYPKLIWLAKFPDSLTLDIAKISWM